MSKDAVIVTGKPATPEENCMLCDDCHPNTEGGECMRDFSPCDSNRCCIFFK